MPPALVAVFSLCCSKAYVREDFPVADLVEVMCQYNAGNVGSNLVTITVADPDTDAAAAVQPEKYELVRVRMGGWTELFSAMFPAHHDQPTVLRGTEW